MIVDGPLDGCPLIILLVDRPGQLNELFPKVLTMLMAADVVFDGPQGLVDTLEPVIVFGEQLHSRFFQDVPKQAQFMVDIDLALALEVFRLNFQNGDLWAKSLCILLTKIHMTKGHSLFMLRGKIDNLVIL